MQQRSGFTNTATATTYLPVPYVSACVGVACVLAYAVPHARRLFAPSDAWSWFAPALEHAGPLHLFFNLYWLHALGPLAEGRIAASLGALATPHALLPPLATVALYALLAAASNAAQYAATGPHFLGLSGVVFGLVGFLATAYPGAMLPGTVRLFAAWFVICVVLTALRLLPVANAAHGAGAAAGAALGWLMRRWAA